MISLQLGDVFTHLIGADPGDFEYVRAAAMEYHIVLPEIVEALVEIGPAEQSSADVWRAITVQRAQQSLRQRREEAESAHALLLADRGRGGPVGGHATGRAPRVAAA